VVNRDDAEAWRAVAGVRARLVSFGAGTVACGAFAGEGFVALRLSDAPEERYGLGRTRLAGRHNVENILAAVTVARLAGAPPAAVQAAIDDMEPLPHRLTRIAERDGVAWYDDSKATNVGAAAKSLDSFAGPVVLLAGGVDKGGGYDALAAAAAGKVRRALVFGEAAEAIGAALAAVAVPVERVPTLEQAVARAAAVSAAGDTVLLAPACASFDMFADYAARGRAFRAAVEALA
jgi:UDP-N-acetylmuramoylalanine--D-glutamate ligase